MRAIIRLAEKAPLIGAFFVACGLHCPQVFGVLPSACNVSPLGISSRVSYAYDGDTVKLADGRIIRLIGINTPEIGHEGHSDEQGALAARQRLQAILQDADNLVLLQTGRETKDRYQRLLAHLYTPQGRNISAMLLRDGLGYAIHIPPNLGNLECYIESERSARDERKGLWESGENILVAERMSGREEGFYLVQGVIKRIGKSKRSLWLNLHHGPAIRIDWSDWQYFEGWDPDNLKGRQLEVRGWIYRRKGQQRINVRHPAAIRWLD